MRRLCKYDRISCAGWHAGVHVVIGDRCAVLLWLARTVRGGHLQEGSHCVCSVICWHAHGDVSLEYVPDVHGLWRSVRVRQLALLYAG